MRSDLERFILLDDADQLLVDRRRGGHNRLGFALQLTTVRYLGAFLEDPLDVPWAVVEYLAEQVGVLDPSIVKSYTRRRTTRFEHAWEIQGAYGFRSIEDPEAGREFEEFLRDRAWVHAEGPAALFNQAVGWLLSNRILLPGITVLDRLVSKARSDAAERVYELLAAAARDVDPMLPGRLRQSLRVPTGFRFSELESWKQSPTRISGPAMVSALDRALELESLRVRDADCSVVPPSRIAALGRYGMVSKAAALVSLVEPRRTGTLLALVKHLDAVAVDDVLDLFALLMSTRLINQARAASNTDRLASLPRLEKASRILALVNRQLIAALDAAASEDNVLNADALWRSLEEVVPKDQIVAAVETVTELVPDDDGSAEVATRVALAERYRTNTCPGAPEAGWAAGDGDPEEEPGSGEAVAVAVPVEGAGPGVGDWQPTVARVRAAATICHGASAGASGHVLVRSSGSSFPALPMTRSGCNR